jgi:hypothetical protein
MSDWDNLNTYDDWRNRLDQLLAEGRDASSRNDDEARWRVCADLRMFVQKSRPNTDQVLELDRIASAAAKSLSLEAASGAIGRIESRTAELVVLSKELQRVGERAASSAVALRLERARAATEALAGIAGTLAGLDATLRASAGGEELSARITTIMGMLKDLGDAIHADA